MQNLVAIYEDNARLIKKFIASSLQRLALKEVTPRSAERLFSIFPSLELLYECDEGFVQVSPNRYPTYEDSSQVGMDRSYLIDEHTVVSDMFISEPYISSATGQLCITTIYPTAKGFIFLDLKVRGLLERFDLIEKNTAFRQINRISYALIGGGLLFFGLFVVLYGFYTFGSYFVSETVELSLDAVFKPVIALTLGLAVFDLGKTIFEQEVLPKTQHLSDAFNPKTLLNFSVSIIIALLIEALLVVFKISISDYRDLPYAAWLIAALSLLLLVFSVFVYMVRKNESSETCCEKEMRKNHLAQEGSTPGEEKPVT